MNSKKYLLGDFAEVKSGYAFKSKDMNGGDFPIVKIRNITPPTVDLNQCDHIDSKLVQKNLGIRQFELQKGDILIAMTGATVGKIGRVPTLTTKTFLNQRVGKVFLRNESLIDYEYLYYYLSQDLISKTIMSQADGSAQGNISGKQIENLPIFVPDINQQHVIAKILGALDKKIEINQKINSTLEDVAKAIFKSWFINFDPVRKRISGESTKLPDEVNNLFPSNFIDSDLGEIPQGWEIKTVSDFGKIVCGKTPSTKVIENFNGEFPFITIPDMRSGIINSRTERTLTQLGASELSGKMLPEGAICVSCIATPGLVTITSTNSFTNQQINSIIPNVKIHRDFLFFSMLSLESVIKNVGSGGSVFNNLNTSEFKLLPIIKPPENLIHKFSEISNPILEKMIINQKQSSVLTNIKETLLPKLISGELQISNAEKFLEEAGV